MKLNKMIKQFFLGVLYLVLSSSFLCLFESDVASTPAGPFIPRWYKIEILAEDSALNQMKTGVPVEIGIRISALIGDLKNLYIYFGFPEGLQLENDAALPKDYITIKQDNHYEFKVKIVANKPIWGQNFSVNVAAEFPYDAVHKKIMELLGEDGIKHLRKEMDKMKTDGFQGWAAQKVSVMY